MEVKDPETQKVLRDGQMLEDGVNGDFWRYIKSKLEDKLNLLDRISATIFEGKTKEQIADELQARAGAVTLVKEWIAEVEGAAEQHKLNKETLSNEDYIIKI